jgi:sugar lactone lactonase YvrE
MGLLRQIGFLIVAGLVLCPLDASAWDRGSVQKFATLPAGDANPEGLTVDARGNVYVTTFRPAAPPGTQGRLIVFAPSGRLVRAVDVVGSSSALLGLAFHPTTGALLVLDLGHSQVLSVDPSSGMATIFATMPAGSGLNALTFDKAGNVYVSDSFNGIIWRTGPNGGTPQAWVTDPLLKTTGVPGFGANGLEFNKAGNALCLANTGDDSVVRIPVNTDGSAGTPEPFVYSINGADGLAIDDDDNIWVAANQSDEIVVIDKTGKVIAKLGDFDGIDPQGSPIGLLFPASPALFGNWLYVTNLSLDLRNVEGPQTIDSQWADQVTLHTVSRLRAGIPGKPGGHGH